MKNGLKMPTVNNPNTIYETLNFECIFNFLLPPKRLAHGSCQYCNGLYDGWANAWDWSMVGVVNYVIDGPMGHARMSGSECTEMSASK